MTTQLPERLRDLADDAPGPLSPEGMWHTGRRRHRRRQVTVAAVVGAVVALTAGAGFGDWQSRRPDPAAPPATQSGSMPIPDEFFEPSPWLPITSKPGRLVAIMTGISQKHLFGGTSDGVVGIAAGSQRYTFLRLPGRTSGTAGADVYLAPDGQHLAYVTSGPISEARHDVAGGVAVLDLAGGEVQRYPIPSQHGLNMVNMRWTSPASLFVHATQERDAPPGADYASSFDGTAFRLDVGARSLVRLAVRNLGYDDDQVTLPGLGAAVVGERQVDVLDARSGHSLRTIHLSRTIEGSVTMNAAEDRIAGLGNSVPDFVEYGHVRHGRVAFRRVPGTQRYAQVLGWIDASHLLARRDQFVKHGEYFRHHLVSLDVRTGRARALSVLPNEDLQIAGQAVASPAFVPGVAPPHPWSRRVEVFGLLGVLALGVLVRLYVRFDRVRS